MTNKFTDAIEREVAWKQTENGLDALNTTFDANLDLFATIGALRKRSDSDIETKIIKAYDEDALVCMKMLFYARDIREGLGERAVFRIGLRLLANIRPEDVRLNIANIVKFGRFDDLYELVGTAVEEDMWQFIRNQWVQDTLNYADSKPISLMAKWLKSVNASSAKTNELGRKTATALGLSVADYRKSLASLRKYLKVTEGLMSQNHWEEINFSAVPGNAMKKYSDAFERHLTAEYNAYIEAIREGKTTMVDKDGKEVAIKINSKHLFPYEILEKMSKGKYFGLGEWYVQFNATAEALWKGLNDWLQGTEQNVIIMADTSASMDGRPMATSVGLGIYFAERNQGPFHNKFMTFSSKPSWIRLPNNPDATLYEKVRCIPEICENTNIEAGLDLILNVGLQNKLTQEEMPKSLVIISDMEFDRCVNDVHAAYDRWSWNYEVDENKKATFVEKMKAKWAKYGYELPEIVFWNVDARQDTMHADAFVKGIRMVSGQSPSVFKSLIDGKTHTPYEFMLETLSNPRYDCIKVNR